MKYEAIARSVHMSPLKLRQVARSLKGMAAADGCAFLQLVPRKSARLIRKTVGSAIAAAENNFSVPVEHLAIENVIIEEGGSLRRHVPAARGSAHPIRKRMSHIRVILIEKQGRYGSES